MAHKISDGFEKATSTNLPRLTADMLASFFRNTQHFINPESRNVKTSLSMRPEYGDAAIEYVQVRRKGGVVEVRAGVCPETSIRKRSYNLLLSINSTEILSAECLDCKGSKGGCKHSVALVAWLHRRSEEPSPTEVKCYWKKSYLSGVGIQHPVLTAKQMAGTKETSEDNDRSINTFLNSSLEFLNGIQGLECNLLNQFNPSLTVLSMHSLLLESVEKGMTSCDQFLNFVKGKLRNVNLTQLASETEQQSASNLWRELRYARITASKLHEIAHCNTPYGSLVKLLLGATKIKDNKYLKRGRDLEPEIVSFVQKYLGKKIYKTGLVLHPEYPLFGASPDGISQDFIIEVKCPFHSKSQKKYLDSKNQPALKHKLQMLLQMLLCDKQYGFFCVADSDYENSNKVTIVKVLRDDIFLMPYIEKANKFWETNIFSHLMKGALHMNK